MKTFMMLLTAICLGASGLALAEPYADKVKITSNTSPIGQMMIKASIVPERSAVNIPPYPGAVILQTAAPGAMKMNGKDALPYIKLLTQLFGDRLVVANATGCSSIYGGNLPTTPWTTNADGRGNSLIGASGPSTPMSVSTPSNHVTACTVIGRGFVIDTSTT